MPVVPSIRAGDFGVAAMTIHELLSKFDPSKLFFQRLDQCLTAVKATKRKTVSIQFETDQVSVGDVLRSEGKIGLVLWIPAEQWNVVAKEQFTPIRGTGDPL